MQNKERRRIQREPPPGLTEGAGNLRAFEGAVSRKLALLSALAAFDSPGLAGAGSWDDYSS